MQKISLESLILKRSSNVEQAHRPMAGHTTRDTRKHVTDVLFSDENRRPERNEGMLSKLAPKLIRLGTPEVIVSIPNGWEEDRWSFVLVCYGKNAASGKERKYVVTGFTDMAEISSRRSLPEETVFYINSVKTTYVDNGGCRSICSTDEYLHSPDVESHSLSVNRPFDAMRRSSDNMALYNEGNDDVGIVNKVNYVSSTDTKVSKTKDRSPTNYLSSIMTATRQSQTCFRRTASEDAVLKMPHHFAHDRQFSMDMFIQAINQTSESKLTTSSFTAEWLNDMDHTLIRDRTEVYNRYERKESSDHLDTGASAEIAAAINVYVSSIAMGLGVETIVFKLDNLGRGGDLRLDVLHGTTIYKSKIMADKTILEFEDEFLITGGNFCTRNGEERFEARVDFDILLDAKIEVDVDGYYEPYVFSTSASNLTSPIISPRKPDHRGGTSDHITDSLAGLTGHIQDAYMEMNVSLGLVDSVEEDRRGRSSYLAEPSYDDYEYD